MPDSAALNDLADMVAERRGQLGRRVAVGISGVDCAGKSTLAAQLAARLGSSALVISGDDLTRPSHERYAEPDLGLGYYRDSFDYSELTERLLPAFQAGVVGELPLRLLDRGRDEWRDTTIALGKNTTLIVEGCFLFAAERRDAFDIRVWIDLPLDRVVERALRRPLDLERMGGPDGVRARYAARYLPGQALHLARDAPSSHVDVVLSACDLPR